MSTSTSGRSVATIERAAEVLFLLAKKQGTIGVTEISKELEISKAVVHRIVTSLCEHDLVSADLVTRRYSLGPGVLRLSAAYLDNLDVHSMALDAMHRLSATTNETATLSVRNGNKRVFVDQVTPPREVKMTVQLAAAFPLHAGASSKAFLAWLSPEDIDGYLAGSALEALTDATIVSEPELRTELKRIREQGFAVSLGERQAGTCSVAAPVLDQQHRPVAVISVCGPIERFRHEVASSAETLTEATRELSTRLGARPDAS